MHRLAIDRGRQLRAVLMPLRASLLFCPQLAFLQTAFFVGFMAGNGLFGRAGDAYGRRVVMYLSAVAAGVCQAASNLYFACPASRDQVLGCGTDLVLQCNHT